MPDQLQLRGGTTVQHSTFTGASKEVTVDTTKKTAVVHDGSTVGGVPMMREDASNAALALGSAATPSLKFTGDINTGIYSPGADQVAISTGGTGRIIVTSAGLVGIGTSSPDAQLQIVKNSDYTQEINGGLNITDGTNDVKLNCGVDATNDVSFIQSLDPGTSNATRPLTLQPNGGNVGIGTVVPNGTLHVVGDTSALGEYSVLSVSDVSDTTKAVKIAYDDVNDVGVITVIDSGTAYKNLTLQPISGRVGIGTTSPGSALEINAAAATSPFIAKINTAEAVRIDSSGRLLVGTSSARSNVDYQFGSDSPRQQLESANGALGFSIIQNYDNGTAGTPAYLTLARAGSTVVGSTTIVANNNWLGEIDFAGSDGTDFTRAASIRCEVDGTPGANDMPGRLVFSTTADGAASPTERMRIDSSGYVGINATSPSSFNSYFTSISTSASKAAGVFYGNAASNDGQGALQVVKSSTTNTSSQVLVEFYINAFGTGSGRIVSNGASAAAFASFSDENLKENIKDLPGQLDSICKLRPVEFDYKDGSGHQIGFIAQEVQEIYPDVVATGDDNMLTLTGWSKTEARLVKALQEAIARIETLEAEVAALKGA